MNDGGVLLGPRRGLSSCTVGLVVQLELSPLASVHGTRGEFGAIRGMFLSPLSGLFVSWRYCAASAAYCLQTWLSLVPLAVCC